MQQIPRQTIRPSRHKQAAPSRKSAAGGSARLRPILALSTDEAARDYRRDRHLPGLVRLMPRELAEESKEVSLRILQLLRRALRMERQRGRAGHWTYDINRHLGLVRAYKAEMQRLDETHRY